MTVTKDMQAAILKVPAKSWTPAYDGDGQVRDGAWVADISGLLDLPSWPAGMRVIVGKPSRQADQPEPTPRPGRRKPGARGTPPTRRDSRAVSHGRHPKINPSRTTQASMSGTRKIEANGSLVARYRDPGEAVTRWAAPPSQCNGSVRWEVEAESGYRISRWRST
jgi:hypothetical protein